MGHSLETARVIIPWPSLPLDNVLGSTTRSTPALEQHFARLRASGKENSRFREAVRPWVPEKRRSTQAENWASDRPTLRGIEGPLLGWVRGANSTSGALRGGAGDSLQPSLLSVASASHRRIHFAVAESMAVSYLIWNLCLSFREPWCRQFDMFGAKRDLPPGAPRPFFLTHAGPA